MAAPPAGPGPPTSQGKPEPLEQEDRWLLIIDDPITGLLPWLAWSVLPNFLSALTAALIALGIAVAFLLIALLRGERIKLLEASDVVLFAVIALATRFGPGVDQWFENHADLVSNTSLALLAVISLVLNRPFTAPYTEARFPGMDQWLQQRLDRFSTAAWAVGLTVAAFVTWYGEYVLDNPDNLWTGWVLQLLPVLVTYNVTLIFDRRAVLTAAGYVTQRPSYLLLVRRIALVIAPIGVLALLTDAAPGWLADGLMLGGIALLLLVYLLTRRRLTVAALPGVLEDEDEDYVWG